MSRPSWDETWMAVADALAERSLCVRAKVGAVIVTRDNRVDAAAYAGPPAGAGYNQPCDQWCERAINGPSEHYPLSCTIHAEANSLLRSNWTDRQGGTIYATSAVCKECSRLIANSGLQRVVHRVNPVTDSHREPDVVELYLRDVGLTVERMNEGAKRGSA